MTKDEILVLRPLYKMKEAEVLATRLDIRKQLSHGNVITIPFGWSVEISPKDIEIKIAEKPEETSTPWEFVENEMHSPFDGSKESCIICSECRHKINRWNEDMLYCPYCGKRHYFNKQEDKKEEEIWCTECPYFKDVEDVWDRDWFGAKCTKDGHESAPSMYAIQSLHNNCPLRAKKEE